jgi:hypothetical protein
MPSEFPRSPKLLKGALAVFSSQKPGPPPTVIVFQNIVVNAAFLATDQQSNIEMQHMLRAARREYAEIDKLLTEAEFGPHYRLMKS